MKTTGTDYTSKLAPDESTKKFRYLNIHPFELDGRFYKKLGVRGFKRFASSGDICNRKRKRSDPGFRIIKDYKSAIDWDARTRFNELAHIFNLVFNIIMLGWLYFHGRYGWIIPIIMLNLIFNVYPILLQRYNRARIQRIRLLKQGVTGFQSEVSMLK